MSNNCPENINLLIGSRIMQIIKDFNLNKTSFAKKLKISQGYVSEITTGKKNIPPYLIRLISLTFNINEHWLLTGEGEMLERKPTTETPSSLNEDARNLIAEMERYLTQNPHDITTCDNILHFLQNRNISLLKSDVWMARVLEDLIDILIKKGVIDDTDISTIIWERIERRKLIRQGDK